jgi:hypothetical protein
LPKDTAQHTIAHKKEHKHHTTPHGSQGGVSVFAFFADVLQTREAAPQHGSLSSCSAAFIFLRAERTATKCSPAVRSCHLIFLICRVGYNVVVNYFATNISTTCRYNEKNQMRKAAHRTRKAVYAAWHFLCAAIFFLWLPSFAERPQKMQKQKPPLRSVWGGLQMG